MRAGLFGPSYNTAGPKIILCHKSINERARLAPHSGAAAGLVSDWDILSDPYSGMVSVSISGSMAPTFPLETS